MTAKLKKTNVLKSIFCCEFFLIYITLRHILMSNVKGKEIFIKVKLIPIKKLHEEFSIINENKQFHRVGNDICLMLFLPNFFIIIRYIIRDIKPGL